MTTLPNGEDKFITVKVEWIPQDKKVIITPKESFASNKAYYLWIELNNGNLIDAG